MAIFVGLDVSLTVSPLPSASLVQMALACGKARRRANQHRLSKRSQTGAQISRLLELKHAPCQNGCTARWSRAVSRQFASRQGMPNDSCHRDRTKQTAAMRAASPT